MPPAVFLLVSGYTLFSFVLWSVHGMIQSALKEANSFHARRG